jgi:hypothetical protein
MKKCPYCGKEYPDDATVCTIDHNPLESSSPATISVPKPKGPAPTPPSNLVKPALMTRLRTLHLYLGCIFAPMLLLFAVTGIWQTLGVPRSGVMNALSSIHTAHKLKNGTGLSSPLLSCFVLLMAIAFIITTILGIVMAVKYGRNRRVAYYCLGFGIAFPLLLILIRAVS